MNQSATATLQEPSGPQPRLWLRAGAILLPLLKCAICPACLSIFGGVFAGARLGFVEEAGWHGWVLAAALLVDLAILIASMRHHGKRGPLLACAVGAVLALGGHGLELGALVEYAGFALLLGAGIWNVILLRSHRHASGECCSHHPHHHAHGHTHAALGRGPAREVSPSM